MSSQIVLFCLALIAVYVDCDKTPALIWSSNRPLSDLSQTFAGETVSTKSFHDDYLKPLTSDPKQSLVVFMQNKLSVEDFTHHADVYNLNSDGGAFKNVKSAMDEQFSVHLPAVNMPKSAVDDLSSTFKGEVIRVDNPEAIADLNLAKDKAYLVIVQLKPVTGLDNYQTFKHNDGMIGSCMHHLQKRDVQFTAIYTAEASSQISADEVHEGRHLLAAAGDGPKPWSNQNLLMYLSSVNLTVTIQKKETSKPQALALQYMYDPASTQTVADKVTDTLISLNMSLLNDNGTLDLHIMIEQSGDKSQWWSINGSMAFTPKSTELQDYAVPAMNISYNIESITGFCYHCSKLSTKPLLRHFNATNNMKVSLILNKFQVQAYFNGTSGQSFSGEVWDCVEFFTIPIWMGIIVTLIIVIILFYGITMLASITTMDRFDDPKGKTITVTVNE